MTSTLPVNCTTRATTEHHRRPWRRQMQSPTVPCTTRATTGHRRLHLPAQSWRHCCHLVLSKRWGLAPRSTLLRSQHRVLQLAELRARSTQLVEPHPIIGVTIGLMVWDRHGAKPGRCRKLLALRMLRYETTTSSSMAPPARASNSGSRPWLQRVDLMSNS